MIKITGVFLLGVILGLSILIHPLVPFGFIFLCFYLWLLLRYPELSLFISIAMILNAFGLINVDFLRLPGVFKLRDIFLISIFVPILIGMIRKDNYKIKYILTTPLAKVIYVIIAISILQIAITKYKFPEETLNSIIRSGRRYLYFAMYFPIVYILSEQSRMERFFKYLVAGTLLFCTLFLAQFVLGPGYRILQYVNKTESQVLQGHNVYRIYLMGIALPVLFFQVCFMLIIFYKNMKVKILSILFALFSGLQIGTTFFRSNVAGALIGAFLGVFFASDKIRTKVIIKIIYFVASMVLIFVVIDNMFFPESDSVLKKVFSRVGSTYNAIFDKDDTFYYRIKDNQGRFELIKNYPVLGVGFVHDESDVLSSFRGYDEGIRTSDSGLLTLFIDLGIIGIVWYLIFSFVFLSGAIKVYKSIKNDFYKCVMLGIIAFYISRWFSSIALPDLVDYDSIMLIAVAAGMMDGMNYFFNKKELS